MKTIYTLLLITFVYAFSSCIVYEEKDFKNNAKHLKQLLIELRNIKTEIKSSNRGPNVYHIDRRKQDAFIMQKKNEWEKLSKEFKDYVSKHPESCWADDAEFCLVMMYLSISRQETNYYIEAINEIGTFLSKFPCFHIETWTKTEFNGVPQFDLIFNKEFSVPDKFVEGILNLPEEKRIRRVFSRAMIQEFLKADKSLEAKEQLKTLEKEREKEIKEEELFLIGLREEISKYDKMKKTDKGKK